MVMNINYLKVNALLDKLLELNAEQQQTTDDIQGRLLLDESVLEIAPVLTPKTIISI